MRIKNITGFIAGIVCFYSCTSTELKSVPVVPSTKEIDRPFGKHDEKAFKMPPMVYHPETWFHFIGGNVSKEGITADLEAVAEAGISGIQLFHGQFGGAWPGVNEQITCLSPSWDVAVKHVAEECSRLGLRFTMQNCPGWAMSGGPWIKPENAMRHLVYSRTNLNEGSVDMTLPVPQPSTEDWRDYKDIAVIAFPTPAGDTGEPLMPQSVKSGDGDLPWKELLAGTEEPLKIMPVTGGNPHWVEVVFASPVTVRTIEFSPVRKFNYSWCYEPGITITVQAVFPDGKTSNVLHAAMPQSSWQDDRPISLACDETPEVLKYRILIENMHEMILSSLRLFSAARKNNWESEAGWTLRSFVRASEKPRQSPEAFVDTAAIIDISKNMDKTGNLKWIAPVGKWTVLRIGHVNCGQKNAPAPPEGTGWECDKLSEEGPNAHFAGYIGRLANSSLAGGLLNGMLLDSWECKTQTWTNNMETEFTAHSGYSLRKWFPAIFGYVTSDHETTARFLLDWRRTVGNLFANKFYGSMAKLAKENGLNIQYETAAGDIFPADILEYFKYADVPMTEFWQPYSDHNVGSINFKPIKPAASAARIYGKPRVAAEAFTSGELTFDEHLSMLKEIANLNCIEGVTHLVFHTYTHNPRTDWLPPGTSFGSGYGTPFLRGQTWWKYMPEFTAYLARLNYLFERGRPVADVLWYIGDEISHKPDQKIKIEGYKYDYCNPDVLLNRLSVKNGKIYTPEDISYSVLWIPENERMLPETLEKLVELARKGMVIVGNRPKGLATLTGGKAAQQRFDTAVKELWDKDTVLSGITIEEALKKLHVKPDVTGGNALWLHRKTENADWYYVSAPYGAGFKGTLSFNHSGHAEIWDPVTGEITPADAVQDNGRTLVNFDLAQAGSCFVVFRGRGKNIAQKGGKVLPVQITGPWLLSFPKGWGVPESLQTDTLKAWKDLDISQEGKAFSGTATYTTVFDAGTLKRAKYSLELGKVEMIAVVTLNGKKLRTLWTYPYNIDITDALNSGKNELKVEVTSTWFNRLVYDAGQPVSLRKTWTIQGPRKEQSLRESGLLGPVMLYVKNLPHDSE